MIPLRRAVLFVIVFGTPAVYAERFIPQSDTSYIDEHGTGRVAHICPITFLTNEGAPFLARFVREKWDRG
jgi:hypothetical protein